MGRVGLTCPCLRHPCTHSQVQRLTLTVTPRKTTEEGKIHSYLINLRPATHKQKNTSGQRKHMQTQRSQYPAPVARLCVVSIKSFTQCLYRLVAEYFSIKIGFSIKLIYTFELQIEEMENQFAQIYIKIVTDNLCFQCFFFGRNPLYTYFLCLLPDMTATVGHHPCPSRPTTTRIWTMRWRRREVPLLLWEEDPPLRQQLPSASLRPPHSALPTMRKCSPFCRPTWTSLPELTSTRWPSRRGKDL